jgi:hypothetical protein
MPELTPRGGDEKHPRLRYRRTASPLSVEATSATTCSGTSFGGTARRQRVRPPPMSRGSSSPVTGGRCGCSTSTTPPSTTPYYVDMGFGYALSPVHRTFGRRHGVGCELDSFFWVRACMAEPYNATYFEEYVAKVAAPALTKVLELYEKLLVIRDGSFTRECGYPRIPDPTGADTGRKIRPQARIQEAKSARGQLTGGNLHPRVYPLLATKTRPMYAVQLFLSPTHQDNTPNPRDPVSGPHLAAATSPAPRLPPNRPLPLISCSQAAVHLQVVERRRGAQGRVDVGILAPAGRSALASSRPRPSPPCRQPPTRGHCAWLTASSAPERVNPPPGSPRRRLPSCALPLLLHQQAVAAPPCATAVVANWRAATHLSTVYCEGDVCG